MTAVDQIRDLEDQRYAAMERGDATALTGLLHPEVTYSHSNGSRDNKDSFLQKIRQGQLRFEPIEHPIDQITVEGTIATVIGAMRCRVHAADSTHELNNCALAVWVHTADGWQLLAYQPTPIRTS